MARPPVSTKTPEFLAAVERIKADAEKKKEQAQNEADKKIDELLEPELTKLETQLAAVCETIAALDEGYPYQDNFLKDERFSQYVAILKKKMFPSSSGKQSGVKTGGNSGVPRPGRKIKSAIKNAGTALSPEEIADATGLSAGEVKTYLKSEHAQFAEKNGKYDLK